MRSPSAIPTHPIRRSQTKDINVLRLPVLVSAILLTSALFVPFLTSGKKVSLQNPSVDKIRSVTGHIGAIQLPRRYHVIAALESPGYHVLTVAPLSNAGGFRVRLLVVDQADDDEALRIQMQHDHETQNCHVQKQLTAAIAGHALPLVELTCAKPHASVIAFAARRFGSRVLSVFASGTPQRFDEVALRALLAGTSLRDT